jgi:hypothetical protein
MTAEHSPLDRCELQLPSRPQPGPDRATEIGRARQRVDGTIEPAVDDVEYMDHVGLAKGEDDLRSRRVRDARSRSEHLTRSWMEGDGPQVQGSPVRPALTLPADAGTRGANAVNPLLIGLA